MRGSVGGLARRRQWRRGRALYQSACGRRKSARSCGVCYLLSFSYLFPVGDVRRRLRSNASEFLHGDPEGISKTTGGHYEDSEGNHLYYGVVDGVSDNACRIPEGNNWCYGIVYEGSDNACNVSEFCPRNACGFRGFHIGPFRDYD